VKEARSRPHSPLLRLPPLSFSSLPTSFYSHSFSGFFSPPHSLFLVTSSLRLPLFHSLLFFFSGLLLGPLISRTR